MNVSGYWNFIPWGLSSSLRIFEKRRNILKQWVEKEQKELGKSLCKHITIEAILPWRHDVRYLANDLSEQIKKSFAVLVHLSSCLNVDLVYGFQRVPGTSNFYSSNSLIDLNISILIRQLSVDGCFSHSSETQTSLPT